MPSSLSRFTMRISSNLLAKLRYIAEYNVRSVNKEVETLIRKHVENFEKEHGEIIIDA